MNSRAVARFYLYAMLTYFNALGGDGSYIIVFGGSFVGVCV